MGRKGEGRGGEGQWRQTGRQADRQQMSEPMGWLAGWLPHTSPCHAYLSPYSTCTTHWAREQREAHKKGPPHHIQNVLILQSQRSPLTPFYRPSARAARGCPGGLLNGHNHSRKASVHTCWETREEQRQARKTRKRTSQVTLSSPPIVEA